MKIMIEAIFDFDQIGKYFCLQCDSLLLNKTKLSFWFATKF